MSKVIKIWLVLLVILGILSVSFTFYETVIKSNYVMVNQETND